MAKPMKRRKRLRGNGLTRLEEKVAKGQYINERDVVLAVRQARRLRRKFITVAYG